MIRSTLILTAATFVLSFAAPDAPVTLKQTLAGHTNAVLSVAFSHDGKHVASGGQDGVARIWDATSGEEETTFEAKYSVTGIAFSSDGKRLFTGSWGGQVWDIETGIRRRHFESHTGFVTCIGLVPSGKSLITASLDGSAKVFDLDTGQETLSLDHGGQVNCLAVSPDGKRLVTGSDTHVRIWEVESGKQTGEFKSPAVTSVVFDPDGSSIYAGHGDKLIRQWDLKTGKELRSMKGHTDRVSAIAQSPDHKMLVSGSADHSVRFWSIQSGEEIGTVQAHDGAVHAIAISKDGSLLATAGSDKLVKLWSIKRQP